MLADRSGVIVGPQRALYGVECAATALRTLDGPSAAAIAVCAPSERFALRRDIYYVRAIEATGKRVARAVRR